MSLDPGALARAAARGPFVRVVVAEKKEFDAMEETILAAEEAVAALESQLNDPEFQTQRFSEIPGVVAKLDAAKAEVARLYARWEELEAIS